MKKSTLKKGFTLIELVVVMAIIAVLAMLIVGAVIVARNTAKETANRTNAKTIQAAMEAFYSKNRAYPTPTGGTTNIAAGTGLTDAAITLGLVASDLDTRSACPAAAGVSWGGGGKVTVSTTSGQPYYTIQVANAACSNTTGDKDDIKGPLVP